MKSLLIFLLCGIPLKAWGSNVAGQWQDRFTIDLDTNDWNAIKYTYIASNRIYDVVKGSESWTLDDFVKSGKFCKIYGHDWIEKRVQGSLVGFVCLRCWEKRPIYPDSESREKRSQPYK